MSIKLETDLSTQRKNMEKRKDCQIKRRTRKDKKHVEKTLYAQNTNYNRVEDDQNDENEPLGKI